MLSSKFALVLTFTQWIQTFECRANAPHDKWNKLSTIDELTFFSNVRHHIFVLTFPAAVIVVSIFFCECGLSLQNNGRKNKILFELCFVVNNARLHTCKRKRHSLVTKLCIVRNSVYSIEIWTACARVCIFMVRLGNWDEPRQKNANKFITLKWYIGWTPVCQYLHRVQQWQTRLLYCIWWS